MLNFKLSGLRTIAVLAALGLSAGCANSPDCVGEPDNPIDRAFAPLDNAVGGLNQELNNEGPDGDCRLRKSSEIQKAP